jgi:hypothetical protein
MKLIYFNYRVVLNVKNVSVDNFVVSAYIYMFCTTIDEEAMYVKTLCVITHIGQNAMLNQVSTCVHVL